jgi:phosphoribosylaminoimidazolecarboxamide formyltransferase/IMP cyclohydrolase
MKNNCIISVFDKTNIISLAERLSKSYTILSSSGTFKRIADNNVPVKEISSYTGEPEHFGGRVKTLHPLIYKGILARRNNSDDMECAKNNLIDIVVVNLYPFEDKNCIDNIDIGGVSLIRAAAKNYEHVLVITDPNDYSFVIDNLDMIMKQDDSSIRKEFAKKAFHGITKYDIAIAQFFDDDHSISYRMYKSQHTLKYGSNPHQQHSYVYSLINPINKTNNEPFTIIQGIPGYINILDALYSWQLVNEASQSLQKVVAASFKHNSPAGVAIENSIEPHMKHIYGVSDIELTSAASAYILARNSDPLSSFGDFIAISDIVDVTTAQLIKREVSDGIIASGYTEDALVLLKQKKGGKYIILQANKDYRNQEIHEYREIFGIPVSQSVNHITLNRDTLNIDSNIPDTICNDMILSAITLKYTPSNSVCYAYNGQVIGIGSGQQNRVDCVKLAGRKLEKWFMRQSTSVIDLMGKFKPNVKRQTKVNATLDYIDNTFNSLEWFNFQELFIEDIEPLSENERNTFMTKIKEHSDVVMASDAFFPFRDNIDVCQRYGVKYILQPGGSVNDAEIEKACHDYNITLVNTGIRLFTH